MKTILNIIIASLVFLICCDIENNSIANELNLNYSTSCMCLAGLLFFGFFRYFWDEILDYLNN